MQRQPCIPCLTVTPVRNHPCSSAAPAPMGQAPWWPSSVLPAPPKNWWGGPGKASWLCGGKGLHAWKNAALRNILGNFRILGKQCNIQLSIQIKISDAICGETGSCLGPVAHGGGRTSDDAARRGHSLGTACGEQKGWQPHGKTHGPNYISAADHQCNQRSVISNGPRCSQGKSTGAWHWHGDEQDKAQRGGAEQGGHQARSPLAHIAAWSGLTAEQGRRVCPNQLPSG